jgi:dihydroxyacetone kinase
VASEPEPGAASVNDATAASRDAAAIMLRAIEITKSTIDARADELGRLDSVAGDGDHGIGMQRGVTAALDAARAAVDQGAGAGTTLRRAADAWADRAGGTSGALWGLGLRALADAVGDTRRPATAELLTGLRDARAQIEKYGKARAGDKTMLDALIPLIEKLDLVAGSGDAGAAWPAAAEAAAMGAAATSDLLPKTGRARPHAEKSLGTPDPGAISLAAIASDVITELSTHA